MENQVIAWLLEGDPAIRWQALRDLAGADQLTIAAEQERISREGWGARLLALQEPSGRWGGGLYSPKWTSTHYTLMLLRRMGLAPGHPGAIRGCRFILDHGLQHDGGIDVHRTRKQSETCVTGMVLSMVAHFGLQDERIEKIVDYLLAEQMADGGWNCEAYRGATHSSVHTTICVLEGLREYEKREPDRAAEVRTAQEGGCEFLLVHRLFRSHRTGEIFDLRMTRFSFPPRWHYDLLRALDYFQECSAPRDGRMEEAIAILEKKRRADGRWPLQNRHAGRTYFDMEEPGGPSRWNTLRALRVLRWWEGAAGAIASE
jgi:hypothetical protein